MHIASIVIENRPPLEHFNVHCDERVNLFIGPNASGKTTILRVMKGTYSGQIDQQSGGGDDLAFFHPDGHFLTLLNLSDDWPRDSDGVIDETLVIGDTVPLLYIPATRINLPDPDLSDQTVNTVENDGNDAPLKDLFDTDPGIFDGRYVELAIDWLRRKMGDDRSQQSQLSRVLQVGYSCASSICPEVIRDDAPHPFVELDEGHQFSDTGVIIHYSMGIRTMDKGLEGPLYVGALSSGTQGTLLWVWALALKMADHYGWTEGWEEKQAILLIDEIENHLHPTWQRRVIPALLEHFPGLQIFAATHSPFVVAGLKVGQVHLLKRDENGNVTATTNIDDVIGWTADEILRTMMGVEDPTDKETAAAARQLRRLRDQGPRRTQEAEEKRQQQMQDLRQRVDRDLLAGGPREAQRELFEQQFADALGKYRKSQNLNQENG